MEADLDLNDVASVDDDTTAAVAPPAPPPAAAPASPDDFQTKVARVQQRMASLGHPITITSKDRTTAQQQALYAQGRTAPGKIVTNADGVTTPSAHQQGRATDVAFTSTAGKPMADDSQAWQLLGQVAKEEGLTWGGDFKSLYDPGHLEGPDQSEPLDVSQIASVDDTPQSATPGGEPLNLADIASVDEPPPAKAPAAQPPTPAPSAASAGPSGNYLTQRSAQYGQQLEPARQTFMQWLQSGPALIDNAVDWATKHLQDATSAQPIVAQMVTNALANGAGKAVGIQNMPAPEAKQAIDTANQIGHSANDMFLSPMGMAFWASGVGEAELAADAARGVLGAQEAMNAVRYINGGIGAYFAGQGLSQAYQAAKAGDISGMTASAFQAAMGLMGAAHAGQAPSNAAEALYEQAGPEAYQRNREADNVAKSDAAMRTLGLGNFATEDDVRAAYRNIARESHPDANPSPEAAGRFQAATEAYNWLLDPNEPHMPPQPFLGRIANALRQWMRGAPEAEPQAPPSAEQEAEFQQGEGQPAPPPSSTAPHPDDEIVDAVLAQRQAAGESVPRNEAAGAVQFARNLFERGLSPEAARDLFVQVAGPYADDRLPTFEAAWRRLGGEPFPPRAAAPPAPPPAAPQAPEPQPPVAEPEPPPTPTAFANLPPNMPPRPVRVNVQTGEGRFPTSGEPIGPHDVDILLRSKDGVPTVMVLRKGPAITGAGIERVKSGDFQMPVEVPPSEAFAPHAEETAQAAEAGPQTAAAPTVTQALTEDPYKLTFVRHGETKMNQGNESQEALRGWLDVPLTDQGRADAVKAADALATIQQTHPFDRIVSSDLVRAADTAHAIGQRLGVPVETTPNLRPWNVGDLAGRPIAEIKDQMLDLVAHPDVPAPNGESFQQFLDRFVPAIKAIHAEPGRSIVVAHTRNAMVLHGLASTGGASVNPEFLARKHELNPAGIMLVDPNWGVRIANDVGAVRQVAELPPGQPMQTPPPQAPALAPHAALAEPEQQSVNELRQSFRDSLADHEPLLDARDRGERAAVLRLFLEKTSDPASGRRVFDAIAQSLSTPQLAHLRDDLLAARGVADGSALDAMDERASAEARDDIGEFTGPGTQQALDRLNAEIGRREGQQPELPGGFALGARPVPEDVRRFSADGLEQVLGLPYEQAEFVEELADLVGMPKDKIDLTVGGLMGPGALYQDLNAKREATWYYDNIAKALETWQRKGTADQLTAHLKKFKGANEEAEAIGLPEWLKAHPSVTRDEVQQFLNEHQIVVKEVQLGGPTPEGVWRHVESDPAVASALKAIRDAGYDVSGDEEHPNDPPDLVKNEMPYPKVAWPDVPGDVWDAYQNVVMEAYQAYLLNNTDAPPAYAQYQTPGGENYRELLLTLPKRGAGKPGQWEVFDPRTGVNIAVFDTEAEAKESADRQHLDYSAVGDHEGDSTVYTSSHWAAKNVIAHVRFNERVIDGRRTLFLEEVQSDWARDLRKYGVQNNGGSVNIPAMPFAKGWTRLVAKRMLAYAAEHGYDAVAWTSGETQRARYDLGKHVDRIEWANGTVAIRLKEGAPITIIVGPDGVVTGSRSHAGQPFVGKRLDDVVGKGIADQISQTAIGTLKEEGLKIGGEWATNLYDRELPSIFNDLLKKYGARVSASRVRWGLEDFGGAHVADLPPEAREAIRDNGLPLFQDRRAAVEFTEGGRAIIRALQSPDVSSAIHEMAHVIRRWLLDRNVAPEHRRGVSDEDIRIAEDWAGAKDGQWTREAEEKFARGFERYLQDGVAPTSALKRLFARFAQWLAEVYDRLGQTLTDVEISPAMRAVFDRLVTRAARVAEEDFNAPEPEAPTITEEPHAGPTEPEVGSPGAGESGRPAGGLGAGGAEGVAGEQPSAGPSVPPVAAPEAGGGGGGAENGPLGAGIGAGATGVGPVATGGPGADAAGDVDPADAPGLDQVTHDANARGEAPRHFVIGRTADLTEGGWTKKLADNLAAIELLKNLQRDGRMASGAEQQVLARYVGWGATELSKIVDVREGAHRLDVKGKEARQTLQQLLSPEELRELGESSINAHYSFADLPRAMWQAVQHMGFKGGAILEPAIGTGHFFGTMPGPIVAAKNTRLFGVDKEPIASAIARQLYQGADIQNSPLQDAQVAPNYFDLAISNVPFAKIRITDQALASSADRAITGNLHNYYFGKALLSVRPGGLIAFITSHFTMDSASEGAREYMAQRAKFLGAVRLPREAFKAGAGTEVVADVIFLQRLQEGETSAGSPAWREAPIREDIFSYDDRGDRTPTHVNEYFRDHPDMVLGKETGNGKLKGGRGYTVEGEGPNGVTVEQLSAAMAKLPKNIYQASRQAPRKLAKREACVEMKQGLFVLDGGKLYTYDQGTLVPSDLKGRDLSIAKAYVPLRDAYQKVLDAQAATDEVLEAAQEELRTAYDTFVKKFGPVNKTTNRRIIETDPNGPRVLSLENIAQLHALELAEPAARGGLAQARPLERRGQDIQVTGLADIFKKRVIKVAVEPKTAGSPQEALTQSLAWRNGVDLEYMAALTSTPEGELVQALVGRIYQDPVSEAWVTADEYLSGDVVTKLAQAEARAKADPRFAPHVAALQAVQPTPYTPDQFKAPFGATWVPTSVYAQFLTEEGRVETKVSLLNTDVSVKFFVDAFGGRHQFMPPGASFEKWAADALNGRLPDIKTTGPDGKPMKDPVATEQYRQSLQQLRESWAAWWPTKDAVAKTLTDVYNAMFNRDVERQWDGSHLVVPNMTLAKAPRPWQNNVVWRGIQGGNLLIAEAVGAGKTMAVSMLASMMKHFGRANKPMITVPNPLIRQWELAYKELFPTARVLVPSAADFEATNRRKFVARVASNDWDAIIIAHSQFERVSVALKTLQDFFREQEDQLIAEGAAQLNLSKEQFEELVARADAQGVGKAFGRNAPQTAKEIAMAILRLRERLKKRTAQFAKDAPVTFEELGVDALFVDEAHKFKSLYFTTAKNKIAGLKGSDSARAMDMFLKARHINRISNNRNLVFATATPITNAMSEIYTNFRYLAMDKLDRLGMGGFDAWANAFAVAEAKMEKAPGGGYVERTRLRHWSNLRDLSKLFRQFADVVTQQDLRTWINPQTGKPYLHIPDLETGHRTTVATEPSAEQLAYNETLKLRASALKSGQPLFKGDNHLLLSTDASKSAIDMRLVKPHLPADENGRIATASRVIADRYKTDTPTRGTQLVFLDIGVPKGKLAPLPDAVLSGTPPVDVPMDAPDEDEPDEEEAAKEAMVQEGTVIDLYAELKQRLVAQGVPADEIAFLHQARNPAEQQLLYDAVNSGRVRVFVTTRSKGALGVNVQERARRIMQVDVPWRPDELEQSEGRAFRQGNTNPLVEVVRFVTKNSFDEYRWDVVARKQANNVAFYRGDLDTLDDEDTMQVDAEVASALGSGDPRQLTVLNLARDVQGLRLRAGNFERRRSTAKAELASDSALAESLARSQGKIAQALAEAEQWQQAPTISLIAKAGSYRLVPEESPAEFNWADPEQRGYFRDALMAVIDPAQQLVYDDTRVATAGPFSIVVSPIDRSWEENGQQHYERGVVLSVDVGTTVVGSSPEWMKAAAKPPDFLASLRSYMVPARLQHIYDRTATQIQATQERIAGNQAILEKTFPQSAELAQKERDLRRLQLELGLAKFDRADDLVKELTQTQQAFDDGQIGEGEYLFSKNRVWDRASKLGLTQQVTQRYGEGPEQPASTRTAPLLSPEVKAAIQEPAKAVARQFVEYADDLATMLAPPTVSEGATRAANRIREGAAVLAHRVAYAENALKAAHDLFERMVVSHDDIIAIADQLEDPERFGEPPEEFKAIGKLLAKVFGELKAEIDRLGKGMQWRDHYLAHPMWVQPGTSVEAAAYQWARLKLGLPQTRPLAGTQGFRHKRTFPTVGDGIRAGWQVPEDGWNPIDWQIFKIREMAKAIMGWTDLQVSRRIPVEYGGWKFVSSLRPAPKGLVKIPDLLGDVWLPPKITLLEAYDKLLMEGLEQFVAKLNVKYVRKPGTGRVAGQVNMLTGDVTMRAGTSEYPLMHEIGHALEAKFPALAAALRQFPQELEQVAKLRYEGTEVTPKYKKYVHDRMEEFANFIHAYIYVPEKAKALAPNAYAALEQFIDDHPDDLHDLRDLQDMRGLVFEQRKYTQPLAGPVKAGSYYAMPQVARLYKNYLSPGVANRSAILRSFRWLQNNVVRMKLGLSAFHLGTIGLIVAPGQGFDMALRKLMQGDFMGAATTLAKMPARPVTMYLEGSKIADLYKHTDPSSVMANEILRKLMAGGSRIQNSAEYRNKASKQLRNALLRAAGAAERGMMTRATKEALRAAFHALPAAFDATTWFIMDRYVPYVKAAAMIERTDQMLSELPGEPDVTSLRKVAAKAQDVTDDLYGQVVYDNLFWKRGAKELMQGFLLSFGWTGGELRWLGRIAGETVNMATNKGRASRDTYMVKVPIGDGAGGGAKPPKPPTGSGAKPGGTPPNEEGYVWTAVKGSRFGIGTGMLLGVAMATLMISNLIQRLHGQGWVESLNDYLAPRIGGQNPDGTPRRVKVWGYMPDIFNYLTSPVQTFFHKMNPLLRVGQEWYTNEDYFGNQIQSPGDDVEKRMHDYGMWLFELLSEPISVSNFMRTQTPGDAARGLVGLNTPARSLTATKAEQLLHDMTGDKWYSRGEADQYEWEQKWRAAQQKNDVAGQNDAAKHLPPTRVNALKREERPQRGQAPVAAQTWLERHIESRDTTFATALKVYTEAATPEERGRIWQALQAKYENGGAIKRAAPAQRAELTAEWNAAKALPKVAPPKGQTVGGTQ